MKQFKQSVRDEKDPYNVSVIRIIVLINKSKDS